MVSCLKVPRFQHRSQSRTPERYSNRDLGSSKTIQPVQPGRLQTENLHKRLHTIRAIEPTRFRRQHTVCAAAQLDSPLTESTVPKSLKSIDSMGLQRTSCPLLVFDSNGVITLVRLFVCTVPIGITCALVHCSVKIQKKLIYSGPKTHPKPPKPRIHSQAKR